VFDRSQAAADAAARLEQADGTAWMAFYCGNHARRWRSNSPQARSAPTRTWRRKFFEHFVHIADAMNNLGGTGLWDEEDGFYYDQLHCRTGSAAPLQASASMVGLLPLFAVEVLEAAACSTRTARIQRSGSRWFVEAPATTSTGERRPLAAQRQPRTACCSPSRRATGCERILALPARRGRNSSRPHGIRSRLAGYHERTPSSSAAVGGQHRRRLLRRRESDTGLFGGNSNWRGPVWFPIDYLLIEALERYHHFYGPEFTVECPVGSGKQRNLREIAADLEQRLGSLFLPDKEWAASVSR
jgi:hypothetical protein